VILSKFHKVQLSSTLQCMHDKVHK